MRRILPALVAFSLFAAMAVLYATGNRSISDPILRAIGVGPFDFPFLDTETVMSAVRCLKDGVDVFETNPCDPLRRVFDYSPLWLLLAKLPVTAAWTAPMGILIDLAFIASLLLLPVGRNAAATLVIVLGVLSPAAVFAVERGNNDLVLFALAAVAAALAVKPPALRIVGYAAALLAGLLKYYPMTLLALATRERPARFFAIAAGAAAVVALFLVTMGHDLMRALHLIPVGSWYGDMFGWSSFAGGFTRLMGWPEQSAIWLQSGLTAVAVATGVYLSVRPWFVAALDRLTDAERMSLLAGCLLILSCYFTAQNIGYRVTHLLLTLPALTALWQIRAGRLWTVALILAVALMWTQSWRYWLFAPGRPGTITGWAIREALWWPMTGILIAIATSLLTRSEMGRRARRMFAAPSVKERVP